MRVLVYRRARITLPKAVIIEFRSGAGAKDPHTQGTGGKEEEGNQGHHKGKKKKKNLLHP